MNSKIESLAAEVAREDPAEKTNVEMSKISIRSTFETPCWRHWRLETCRAIVIDRQE